MTLKEMRSIVKRTTKSDSMNMPDYSIDYMINLSQKEIVRDTLCLKKSATQVMEIGVITNIADYGSVVTGTIFVEDIGHGLSTGDDIYIYNTTSYNGHHQITKISADEFYFEGTYVAAETSGNWVKYKYSLPSDYHKAVQFKLDDVILHYQLEEYVDRQYQTSPETGTPYYYYLDIENSKYGIYPYASSTLSGKMIYYAKPTALSSDSDTPDIPELYHEAIVLGATYRVFEQLNNQDMKTHYYAMFKQYMNEIANDMNSRQATNEQVMPYNWDILDA